VRNHHQRNASKTRGILEKGIPLSSLRNNSENIFSSAPTADRQAGEFTPATLQRQNRPEPQRLSYSVAQAAVVSSISRSKLYELIKNGRLGSIKIGGRRLVRHSDLVALLSKESE
jgi:excisionase family DNA binding protein